MSLSFWSMMVNVTSNYGGPTYGTKYDISKACSKCGTGAERIGPLIVSSFKPPKRPIFATLNSDILVAESFINELLKEGINSFSDVIAKKDGKKLPYKVLDSEVCLPPFHETTTGYEISRKRQCSECERDGYFGIPHIPLELRYMEVEKKILRKDLLFSYEHFGFSALRSPFTHSVFATPICIVSDKFKKIVEKNNANKCMSFEHVFFE